MSYQLVCLLSMIPSNKTILHSYSFPIAHPQLLIPSNSNSTHSQACNATMQRQQRQLHQVQTVLQLDSQQLYYGEYGQEEYSCDQWGTLHDS